VVRAWNPQGASGRRTAGGSRSKDELLDEIGSRLTQNARLEPLFTLRWRLS